MHSLPWIILFLPLLAAAWITLFTQRNRQLSAGLSTGAIVAGFVLSLVFVGWAGWVPARGELAGVWLRVGELQVDVGLRLDPLSLLMMLIVTGVASAIHIYSWGYMHGDRSFPRFFAFLSLFTFSMLGIVLANNFIEMFIFWELVGVSSYLLIAFWFERPSAAEAGKKAFITNRLGDFGFFLGILVVWTRLGSLNFGELEATLRSNHQALGTLATMAGLLIFCGAMGKSAQFPLHVWLPDAMEGPTPVSALIHAATMVAAGVYMLCRVFFLFNGPALEVISWIGGFTALLAATIAVQQNDIKRILAYSTLSQLGYMVMSVGLGGPVPAMFHLSTHAFFKALLFLGAGSIIIALHHEQNIWQMGGLRTKMKVTFWTFLAGTLALAGVPPFSGFYSKDSLLANALQHSLPLFVLGVVVAALTTFYMFRLVFVVFGGSAKSKSSANAPESPPVMLWPLRILALFSIAGGLIGLAQVYEQELPGATVENAGSLAARLVGPFIDSPGPATLGLLAVIVGFVCASSIYRRSAEDPLPNMLPKWLGPFWRAVQNRFYFDEFYEATFIRFHDWLASLAAGFDRLIVSGLGVRGIHGTVEFAGRALRLLQTGNLQTYAFIFALGVALFLYLALGR